MKRLREKEKKLRSPRSFFDGKRLPENIALPDNIIMFHHDFLSQRNIIHQRYTLVIPNGKMNYIIDSSPVALQTGDALLIFPGQERFLVENSQCYSRLFITFDLAENQEYIPTGNLGQFGDDSVDILCGAIDFYTENRQIECSVELVRFFYSLKNVVPHPPQKRLHPAIAQALAYINFQLTHQNRVNVKILAQKLHISESHLRLLFHRTTGTSISDYISKENLKTAKYHLLYSDKSVAEIAFLCGYQSIYAFSAFFKKQTGLSPLTYKKQNSA